MVRMVVSGAALAVVGGRQVWFDDTVTGSRTDLAGTPWSLEGLTECVG